MLNSPRCYAAVQYDVNTLIQHMCHEITRIQLESKQATLLPELVSMLQPHCQCVHVNLVLRYCSSPRQP